MLFCRKRREETSRESQRPDNKSLLQSFLQKRSKKVKDLRAKGWIIREPDREEALSSKPSQKKVKDLIIKVCCKVFCKKKSKKSQRFEGKEVDYKRAGQGRSCKKKTKSFLGKEAVSSTPYSPP